jgi:hypothetical protein
VAPDGKWFYFTKVIALAQDKSDEKQRKLPHTLLVWLFASPLSKTSCLSAMLS